ncbi:MAG: fumarylacetoacetate hydrolase family protein [Acidobacteriia bacterium]|nr:fumarylacetoacetate hydrolase family protein [Terriglobia bacterium]
MRLGQISWNGAAIAAAFEGAHARAIAGHSLYDLLCRAEREGTPLGALARQLASETPMVALPRIPIHPPEVWGCGCTYESSAAFREAEHGTREGFYAQVYRNERPEVFFKGTARVCVGPGEAIGIRPDSKFTAPEPELAVLLGSRGRVLGYTLANDVSAWDIERQNPLYLTQSKIFTGACAFGPVFVTPDELGDLRALRMSCRIERNGRTLFSDEVGLDKLNRKIETLIEFLMRSNPVPAGTLLLTGTGIIAPQEAALAPGDIVTIAIPQIGELRNPAAALGNGA